MVAGFLPSLNSLLILLEYLQTLVTIYNVAEMVGEQKEVGQEITAHGHIGLDLCASEKRKEKRTIQ